MFYKLAQERETVETINKGTGDFKYNHSFANDPTKKIEINVSKVPIGSQQNTKNVPNLDEIGSHYGEASQAGLELVKKYRKGVPTLTGSYPNVYGQTTREGIPYFLWKGQLHQNPHAMENQKKPDVRIPYLPTDSRLNSIPEKVLGSPKTVGKITQDIPENELWNPKTRFSKRQDEVDVTRTLANAATLTKGHFDLFDPNRTTDPNAGVVGAGSIEGVHDLFSGKNINFNDIPYEVRRQGAGAVKEYMKGKIGTDYENYEKNLDNNYTLFSDTKSEMKKRNQGKLDKIYTSIDKGVDEGYIPNMYWDESKHGKLWSKEDIGKIKQWGSMFGGWDAGNLTEAQRKAMEDYKKFSGGKASYTEGQNISDVLGLSNILSSGGKLWQQGQGVTTNLGPGAGALGVVGSAMANIGKTLFKGQPEGTFSNLDYQNRINMIDQFNKEYSKLPKEQQGEYKATATRLLDPNSAWNEKLYGKYPTTPEGWNNLKQRIETMEKYYGNGQ